MAVRAKVRCTSLENSEVEFETVYEEPDGRDTENQRFTQATPWGHIKLGINNQAAIEQFEVGREYYVDFSPAG